MGAVSIALFNDRHLALVKFEIDSLPHGSVSRPVSPFRPPVRTPLSAAGGFCPTRLHNRSAVGLFGWLGQLQSFRPTQLLQLFSSPRTRLKTSAHPAFNIVPPAPRISSAPVDDLVLRSVSFRCSHARISSTFPRTNKARRRLDLDSTGGFLVINP